MSGILLDPLAQRGREQDLLGTQSDFGALAPGTFAGIPSGLGQGLSRAGATVQALSGDLLPYLPGSQLVRAYDAATGSKLIEQNQARLSDASAQWIKDSRLDPATHGSVSQVLYGVASQTPGIAATFVNPLLGAAVMGSTSFEGTEADLLAQGVDMHTARETAGIDALFAAAGALLPGSIGANRLANTLLVGPGVNIAQDIAGRYTSAQALEANGYHELAAQYRHLDATTLIADAIIGSAFGYAGAKHTQGEVDAALVQRDIRQRLMAGVGTPVDAVSQAKHLAALEKATADLVAGRPVDVSGIEGAKFLHDPQAALADVLERSGYHEEAAQIRELETQLAERGIATPEEEPLPEVPRVETNAKLSGGEVPVRATSKAEPPRDPNLPKAEPLAPHEEAAVATAEAIAAEHATPSKTAQDAAGDGQPSGVTVATPDGDVKPGLALSRADRQIAHTEAEAVQFAAAAACAARHGV